MSTRVRAGDKIDTCIIRLQKLASYSQLYSREFILVGDGGGAGAREVDFEIGTWCCTNNQLRNNDTNKGVVS